MRSHSARVPAIAALLHLFAALHGADVSAQDIFTMSASPAHRSLNQGGSVVLTVATSVVSGAAENITLVADAVPSGVSASFNPNPVAAGASSALTLTANLGAPPTAAALPAVIGVSPGWIATTTFGLTIEDVVSRDGFENTPPGCTSRPLVWTNPAVTYAGQSLPHLGTSTGDANVGDTLTFTAATPIDPNDCLNDMPELTPLRYAWTLSAAPPGSSAVLSDAAAAQPTFIPDQASGQYTFKVVATDAVGNSTPPAFLTIATSSCGASPVNAQIAATPSNLPADPTTLVATQFTIDADPTRCPAAFAPSYYLYAWSVLDSPPASTWVFSNANASVTTFAPSMSGTYLVEVAVRDSHGVVGLAAVPVVY